MVDEVLRAAIVEARATHIHATVAAVVPVALERRRKTQAARGIMDLLLWGRNRIPRRVEPPHSAVS